MRSVSIELSTIQPSQQCVRSRWKKVIFCWSLVCAWLWIAMAPTANADKLLVFAAASLNEPLTQISTEFQRTSGHLVVLNPASSGTLARQIEQGAPAALFISANTEWMDYLSSKELIDAGSRFVLAHNQLVLIAPAGSPQPSINLSKGFPLAELLGRQRLAIGDPDSVPAGIYAKQALQTLGIWDAVSGQLANAADVRAALEYVIQQQTPLGIVYRTDALTTSKVKIIGAFPDDSHQPIVYVAAVTRRDQANVAAQALAHFLQSPTATNIFQRYGFRTTTRP